MKTIIRLSLVAATALAVFASCKKEETYPTLVTRDLSMTLDGEPWNIYYGTNNQPLYIYNADGSFVANYNTSYRFSLEEGDYKVFATNQSVLITPPTNLNDQVIEQDPETKKTFAISTPVVYRAGDPMKMDLFTRTGQLRLHALDVKADKSYSILRAIITTPTVGYHVGEGKPIVAEPIELVRVKETSSGGVGYTEDMNLIGNESEKVNITIEYLDADSNVVKTKPFADAVAVLPNQLTEVTFELNNADEPVIMKYDVVIGQLRWSDNNIYPSVKVEVPEGYTYVEPGADLSGTIKAQLADNSIDKLRIFLKAGAAYTIADKVLEDVTKPYIIMGQEPGFGQEKATLTVYNLTMKGDIDEIRFENLTLRPQRDRLFNIRNQAFHIGEIAFVNCAINNWTGVLWTSSVTTDNTQTVDKVRMDGCRLTNLNTSANALWNPNAKKIAPIYNWEFTNTLFHGKNFGTRNAILTGLAKTPGTMSVTVDGCTFIDGRGTDCTYFDIDGAAATALNLTVRNNIVSGAKTGVGTWFKLGKTSTPVVSGNTRTAGFEMKAYGVDAPAESTTTYNDLLSQHNL